jgi:acyl-CoA dehydrogenase
VVVEDDAVLSGDGWDAWLKPFRTIEDTHVLASTVGYLTGAARTYDWDRLIVAELVSIGLALVDVGARNPDLPLTHVALAGLFTSARRLAASTEAEWHKAHVDKAEHERWLRDLPILLVAENARTKRTANAFAALEKKA